MSRLTVDQAMQHALTHHHAGRLGDADAIYRQILSVLPAHPEALHLLGVIASQRGHYDLAIDLVAKAIAAAPTNPSYHFNCGIFLEKYPANRSRPTRCPVHAG